MTSNNRREIIIVVTAFFLLVLMVWGGLSLASTVNTAYATKQNGVYDLRDFDFADAIQIIDGSDGWQSWPGALYSPEDFVLGLPSDGQPSQTVDYTQVEYATHKITLLLPPGEIYSISMKTAVYAQRLYIGGEYIGSVGNPSMSRDEFIPGTFERTYHFMPQTEQVDVIIQTANFVHGKSGCRSPTVYLGSNKNINIMNRESVFFNALILGCLLMAFMYHFSLYLLNRKRVTTLLFSICCLLLALMDKKLLYAFIPDISWYVDIRFEYLVHFLTFTSVIWFLYMQFPKLLHKAAIHPYCILALGYCFTVVFDTRFFTGVLVYFEYASITMILYVVMQFAMSLRSGKAQNILGFIGVLVLGMFGINDILNYRNVAEVFTIVGKMFTVPVGMVFFVFCYSLLIAIEYAETKRNEEALTERTKLLDELNHTKSEFLQDIKHEVRNPLHIISLGADLIRNRINTEEAYKTLDTMQNEAIRLGKMINSMVELATISGKPSDRKRIDFTELLRRRAEIFRLELKQTVLRVEIAPGLPFIYADIEQLERVLVNLFSNAANHTVNGEIILKASAGDSYITICISDTGEGIPPELLPRIFERSVSAKDGGTGYGLYICKTVVEAHGGTIEVVSELAKGTTVAFTIPVYGGQNEVAGHE